MQKALYFGLGFTIGTGATLFAGLRTGSFGKETLLIKDTKTTHHRVFPHQVKKGIFTDSVEVTAIDSISYILYDHFDREDLPYGHGGTYLSQLTKHVSFKPIEYTFVAYKNDAALCTKINEAMLPILKDESLSKEQKRANTKKALKEVMSQFE